MTNRAPEIQHLEEEVEYGLRLPNGTEIWPPETFHGTDSTTPEGRREIVEALRGAAVNIGNDPELFLGEYQWIVRYRKVMVIVEWTPGFEVPLTDPHIIEAPLDAQPVAEDSNAVNTDVEDATAVNGAQVVSDGDEPWIPEQEGRHSV